MQNQTLETLPFSTPLITKKEVAHFLRITTRTLETMMKNGDIDFIRLGKRAIRFDPKYVKLKFISVN